MAKVCVEFDCNGDDGTPAAPVRSFSSTIGDGTNLVYTVVHNLGTSDAFYSLRNTATGELDMFDVSINASSPSQAVLTFATAPAAGSVRVNVLAAPVTAP